MNKFGNNSILVNQCNCEKVSAFKTCTENTITRSFSDRLLHCTVLMLGQLEVLQAKRVCWTLSVPLYRWESTKSCLHLNTTKINQSKSIHCLLSWFATQATMWQHRPSGMATYRSSVCDAVCLQGFLYCVYGSERFNLCYCSGTLKGFKSNQPVLSRLCNSKIDRCSHEWNQELWIHKGKKRIKREKNVGLAADHRKCPSARVCRRRHQSENDKQLFGSTAAIVHKLWILWRKGVWAGHSQAPLSSSFSNMKLLKWEDLRASVCSVMNVDFSCCGKQMGHSELQNSQKPDLETEWKEKRNEALKFKL